ncbi:hypothetical protein [Olivibacter jilunii]|uniref:hypothetical protein n=1 Tax=Olivibacter jilunii TaxID=985016 RepID=UPI003F17C279
MIDLNPAFTTFSLSATKATAILEDQVGNLWIGSPRKLYFYMNRKSDSARKVLYSFQTNTSAGFNVFSPTKTVEVSGIDMV